MTEKNYWPSPALSYSLGRHLVALFDVVCDNKIPVKSVKSPYILEGLNVIEQRMNALRIPHAVHVSTWINKLDAYEVGAYLNSIDQITFSNDLQIWMATSETKIKGDEEQANKLQEKEDEARANPINLFDDLSLNSRIRDACRSRFISRHYADAIFAACKQVEIAVKEKTGIDYLKPYKLMGTVFSFEWDKDQKCLVKEPILRIADLTKQEGRDEQSGFQLLFQGAMLGIRNPKGHLDILQNDPIRTLHYLGLLSLLLTRVEEAENNQPSV